MIGKCLTCGSNKPKKNYKYKNFCSSWCHVRWVRINEPDKYKRWINKHTISRRILANNKMAVLRKEKGNKCEICGYSKEPKILEFHHQKDKKYRLSDASRNNTIDKLREEIKKCVLVCPNCHSIIHLKGRNINQIK